MSEAVEVVTALYRRFERGEAPFDLLAEDVAWRVETLDAPVDAWTGHRGVAEFIRLWLGSWDNYEFEFEEARDLPDGRVLAFFTERATGRGSGVPVEIRPAAIVEV